MFDASHLSPVCFHLFGIDVYWYGVSYVAGMVLAVACANHFLQGEKGPVKGRDFETFVPWAWIGILLGGRLGHVVFYGFTYYLQHPLDILKFRDGGMSFHGGLLGVFLALCLFCSRRKLNRLAFTDVVALVAPLGLFFGRLANFINNELYGTPTSLPWGCLFRGVEEPRHPTQLYEAFFEGLVLWCLLIWAWKQPRLRNCHGKITVLFLVGYSLCRIVIEEFKDLPSFFGLTTGQWLSIAMLLAGWLSWKMIEKKNRHTQE